MLCAASLVLGAVGKFTWSRHLFIIKYTNLNIFHACVSMIYYVFICVERCRLKAHHVVYSDSKRYPEF